RVTRSGSQRAIADRVPPAAALPMPVPPDRPPFVAPSVIEPAAPPEERAPPWIARYPEKIATAAEAVRAIRPGRRVLVGSGAAEPVRLVEAMCARAIELRDVEVVHLLTLG